MCCTLVKVTTGTLSKRKHTVCRCLSRLRALQKKKETITITSRVKSLGSFTEHPPSLRLYIAPVCETNVSTAADSCLAVLYQLLLENLFALPRRGEGASPPFWLLFSAPALSQHSVSSSQSPCQQDFTQWPGELQSVAQHTHTQSNCHTHRKHTTVCTHTSFTLLTCWSTDTFRI